MSLGKGAAPVGLDIGGSTIRAAQLKATADKPVLMSYASAETPKGLINEGEIVDVDGVSKAILSLWRSTKLTEKRVILGVANQKVIVRVVEMPAMSEAELRSAIQYQVQDYIPIPVEEAILDFQILTERFNDQQDKVMDVLLVAARRDMIQNTIAAAEGAGLKPVVVDVSSLAFARSVIRSEQKSIIPDDPTIVGAVAMVNVSSTLTDIVVVEGDIPKFTRISGIGGNVFTEAIAEQLGMEFKEAENLKQQIGLLSPYKEESLAYLEPEVKPYVDAVRNILDQEMIKFIAEIRRSLDYYLVQATKAKSIDRIIVTGGGAQLNNFLDYLKENLQLDVEYGRPLQNVQLSKAQLRAGIADEELSLAICMGLSLRGIER